MLDQPKCIIHQCTMEVTGELQGCNSGVKGLIEKCIIGVTESNNFFMSIKKADLLRMGKLVSLHGT